MFGSVKSFFGAPTVNEKRNIITVDGIPAIAFREKMDLYYESRKISRFMFLPAGNHTLKFYSFFGVEFIYILKDLLAANKLGFKMRMICENILEQLLQNTWLKSTAREETIRCIDLSYLRNLKLTPKPFQYDFLNTYGVLLPKMNLRGMLLASPPGTGKTFMDLAVAACLIPRELAEIKIIISPKNAVHLVWEDTVKTLFKRQPTYWTSAEAGSAPLDREYYIFHYESLPRAIELAKSLKSKRKKAFVIVDEAHNFNVVKSQRTQALIDLCNVGPSMSIWASGSPIKAHGLEIIPLLRSIDPLFTPEVEALFKRMYAGDEAGVQRIISHRIDVVSFKIEKTAVVKEKPVLKKVRVTLKHPEKYLIKNIRIEMQEYMALRKEELSKDIEAHNAQFDACVRHHYEKLRTREELDRYSVYADYITQLKKGSAKATRPDVEALAYCKDYETRYLIPSLPALMQREFKQSRSIVKSMLLKIRGEALGKILAKRRAECAGELARSCGLENIVGEGIAKSLVFSTYTSSLKEADTYLNKLGFTTVNVWGDTAKLVTSLVRIFRERAEVNPLLATYASLSTAVPITEANQVIMLDLPPRQYIYEQTIARALRLGQINTVYVFEILLDTGTEPNVSTRSDEIISWSRNQVSALVGESFGGPQEDDYEIENFDSEAAIQSAIAEAPTLR